MGTEDQSKSIDAALDAHLSTAGPGAAVAVLREGEVVHRRAYGYSNVAEQRLMAPDTPFRICSVTKQFTCLLVRMLESEGKLDLDDSPRQYLPALPAFMDAVTLRQLAQNISGLRDYWCVAMLTGADAQTPFRRADAERVIYGQRSFQTLPGSQYSYNNGNYALLGWVIEAVTGQRYPSVLAARILQPLGMSATFVPSNTGEPLPNGSLGYESCPQGGLMPAQVDIHWEGDAGIVSTLDDLLRWERNFSANRIGSENLVDGLYETPCLPGGVTGSYGFGLHMGRHRGYPTQSHEGGLRGWRMCRIRFPTEGLSVIVLLNHLADAGALARAVADRYLPGAPTQPPSPAPAREHDHCLGFYLDRATGKGFEVRDREGALELNAMGHTQALVADGKDTLATRSGNLRLTIDGAKAVVRDHFTHYRAALERLDPSEARPDVSGSFHSEALQSTLTLESGAHESRVHIAGPLGEVFNWPVRRVGRDVWLLECQRALDHRPPGEFVLWLQREGAAGSTLTASCDLAHGSRFTSC